MVMTALQLSKCPKTDSYQTDISPLKTAAMLSQRSNKDTAAGNRRLASLIFHVMQTNQAASPAALF